MNNLCQTVAMNLSHTEVQSGLVQEWFAKIIVKQVNYVSNNGNYLLMFLSELLSQPSSQKKHVCHSALCWQDSVKIVHSEELFAIVFFLTLERQANHFVVC